MTQIAKNLQLSPETIETISNKNVNVVDFFNWRKEIAEKAKETFDKLNDPEQNKRWNSIYKI